MWWLEPNGWPRMHADDPSHPESVPVQDFLDELRDRFQRVDMVWGPINMMVTLDPEFVLGMLERVPQSPPVPQAGEGVQALRLSLGSELARVVDELPGWYPELKSHARLKLGVEVPDLLLWCDPGLPPRAWTLDLFEEVTARGRIETDLLLARGDPEALQALAGALTVPSKLGLWIPPELEPEALRKGCEVVDLAVAAMLVQLHQVLLRRSCDLLTLQQVHRMVEQVRKTDPLVVDELVPARLSWAGLQEVLRNLLREQVSVRDLRRILEVLLRTVALTTRPDTLTEYVRVELCRGICRRLQRKSRLHVVVLAPELETVLFESSQVSDLGRVPALEPESAQQLLERVQEALKAFRSTELPPVALVSPRVRPLLRRLTERSFPALAVMSWNEIPPGIGVVELARIEPGSG